MTLKEAQKSFDDSIQTKLSHKPNSVTEELLTEIGQKGMLGKEVYKKVLYLKVGRTSSVVISSEMAYKEELKKLVIKQATKETTNPDCDAEFHCQDQVCMNGTECNRDLRE